MALSFSRPDPTSPASIADAEFSTARRGFDQRQVREVLREVAAELGRLIERERFLQHELRTSQEARVDPAAALDEETVSRVVGEETLRVLQTARESATQIKARAEESAARIIREATDEANRLRSDAEVEAARIRTDASTDAQAELALAKQQGREMVNEARAYRERVLSELGRRRDAARQQIDQLVSGRERLLQVFERARLVAVDVMSDLAPLAEPDEYVNLSPTTGPVPLMVPADTAPDAPEDRAAAEPAEIEEVDAVDAVDELDEEEVDEPDEPAEPAAVEPADAVDTGDDDTNVVALFATGDTGDVDTTTDDTEPGDEETGDVDGLFARLRAETSTAGDEGDEGDEGGDGGDGDGAEAEETIFERRDADLVPLITAAARRLKRVLADEQNEALDTLRGTVAVRELDQLVPAVDEHVDRYATAITGELLGAVQAGAALLAPDRAAGLAEPGVLDPVRDLVADGLVLPLRNRLERAVADGNGENDQIVRPVRAVYREWKTKHIGDQLDDVLRLAHGVGVAAAADVGAPMCWKVDPAGPACPDAEDNALAGVVAAGDEYPTGHRLAPAHPGCRCLIAPAGN